jgi:hypothetical protein
MDMQRLFERIADHHAHLVQVEEVRENYLRLLIGDGSDRPQRVEVFPYEAYDTTGATVHLVRVGHPDDGEPVLVSPVPSAIIAVALR